MYIMNVRKKLFILQCVTISNTENWFCLPCFGEVKIHYRFEVIPMRLLPFPRLEASDKER